MTYRLFAKAMKINMKEQVNRRFRGISIGVFVMFYQKFCTNKPQRSAPNNQTNQYNSRTFPYIGTMRFKLTSNPFGNIFGLFCSSRVHPALLGNIFPTIRFPRVLMGTYGKYNQVPMLKKLALTAPGNPSDWRTMVCQSFYSGHLRHTLPEWTYSSGHHHGRDTICMLIDGNIRYLWGVGFFSAQMNIHHNCRHSRRSK